MASILVVDDSDLYRTFLHDELAACGHEVVSVASAAEATGRLEQRIPDLMLLDVEMEEVSGLDLCRHLRSRAATADLPIILVTSKDSPDDMVRGLDLGASDYVSKPVNRDVLLARVRTQLSLKASRDELKRVARVKDEVLSLACHDLRSPVLSILGLVTILTDASSSDLDEFQVRSLDNVRDTAHHMLELIDDVHDIARMEAGRMEIFPVEVDAQQLLERTVKHNAFMARSGGIALVMDVPEPLGTVVADPQKLSQAVNNLISNAIRFSPDQEKVTVGASLDAGMLRIWVEDRGPGVSPETRDAILARTLSLETREGGGERGTGLGLAIARRIVELHGGSLLIESRQGRGSRFQLELPAAGV